MVSKPIDNIPLPPPLPLHLALRGGERFFHALCGRGPRRTVGDAAREPTWSFYFRELIKGLSAGYRCIAPDHVGCGLSARPRASEYGFRLRNRVDDIDAFLGAVDLPKNLTLIVHDWGGMIGAAFAVRHPERIARSWS